MNTSNFPHIDLLTKQINFLCLIVNESVLHGNSFFLEFCDNFISEKIKTITIKDLRCMYTLWLWPVLPAKSGKVNLLKGSFIFCYLI